jgi:MFS transporter, DHA2 family, multidrug resistance protein
VVYLALPRLSVALEAGGAQQLWITDIYGFVTAGLVITMGTLGDRVGRRRLLLCGGAAFGIASIFAAYAASAPMLIAARAVMGLAGATLMPSTLALITNMFSDPRERSAAIAAWTSCFIVGAAIGPVVGGIMLDHFWWGSVFLIGVPVMALLLVTGPFLLPEYRAPVRAPLDLVSVALSLLAVLPCVFAVKEIATDGLSPLPAIAAIVGVGSGWWFLRRQQVIAHPLLDLRLFDDRSFSAALLILMGGLAVQSGVVLLLSEHLQMVQGLAPLRAAWMLMPPSIAMIAGCALAPIATRMLRPSYVVAAGLLVTAAGFLVLARLRAEADLMRSIIGALLVYFGIGPMAVFSQDLIVGSAPPEKAGMAASLSEASGDFGLAMGVAMFGALGAAVYGAHFRDLYFNISNASLDQARESLAGALVAARGLPPREGAALLAAARRAFTDAVRWSALAGAAASVVMAVAAARFLERPDKDR